MSSPANRMMPPVGSSSLRMVRPTVVLPQPDSPTRPSVSPGAIANETSSTALTVAVFDESRPPALMEKYLCRPSTASSGSARLPPPAHAPTADTRELAQAAPAPPACRPRSPRRASRRNGARPRSRAAPGPGRKSRCDRGNAAQSGSRRAARADPAAGPRWFRAVARAAYRAAAPSASGRECRDGRAAERCRRRCPAR